MQAPTQNQSRLDRHALAAAPATLLAMICIVTSAAVPAAVRADVLRTTKPVQISGPSPFAGCTADQVPGNAGWAVANSEVEPWLAVNPTNPSNLVALWSQDWTHDRQGARGLVAGVSFDGGKSWRNVVIPGLTLCSGGSAVRTGDPWLAFAPNGDLYLSALSVGITSNGGVGPPFTVLASKSTDGGLTWGQVATLTEDTNFQDKESITADPGNPNFVYTVWDDAVYGRILLARTANGGLSWEAARTIYNAPNGNLPLGNQIVVLPDGTLLDFFSEGQHQNDPGGGSHFGPWTISLIRSTDKGATWQQNKPIRVVDLTTQCPTVEACVVDPETGQPVRDAQPLFDVAVDRGNGNLYLQWTDGRFSNFQFTSVAFSKSTDGGFTWSTPIKINKTPTNIAPGNQQAFGHSIHVAPDGTIGAAYYDFRFNDPSPGLLTDYWLVHCHSTTDCSNSANWKDENRLTNASFDIEKAVYSGPPPGAFFVGDYQGMASDGSDLLTVWGQPQGADPGSIFFERAKIGAGGTLAASALGPDAALAPGTCHPNQYLCCPLGFGDCICIKKGTTCLAGSLGSTSGGATLTGPVRGVVRVYDVAGRLVRTLPDTWAPAWDSIRWDGRLQDGRQVATGLYFLKLKMADGRTMAKRTVVLR
jgi:hypothetical protein